MPPIRHFAWLGSLQFLFIAPLALVSQSHLRPVSDRHRSVGTIRHPERCCLAIQALPMRHSPVLAPWRSTDRPPRSLYIERWSSAALLLRYAWQGRQPPHHPMSGTADAAMEATLANTVEPGGPAFCFYVKGYSSAPGGHAQRYRGEVHTIERHLGGGLSPWRNEASLLRHQRRSWPSSMAETSRRSPAMRGNRRARRRHN